MPASQRCGYHMIETHTKQENMEVKGNVPADHGAQEAALTKLKIL